MKYFSFVLSMLLSFTTCFAVADEIKPINDVQMTQTVLSAPLIFEKNIGQFESEVKFLSRSTSGTTYFFTEHGVTIHLLKNITENSRLSKRESSIEENPTFSSHSLTISFLGANLHPLITSEEEVKTKVNYFKGKDPSKWKKDISSFHRIRYHNIYEGIDLVYYGNGKQLEYDFVVHPGADPNTIRIHYDGSEEALTLLENGSVAIRTSIGLLHEKKPFAYQIHKNKSEIVSEWKPISETDLQFSLGEYDRSQPLYIDPVIFSTFLGGSQIDRPYEIKIDQTGNIVMVGYTSSTDFPVTIGAIDDTVVSTDMFICRMTPDGSQLLWSTFLGGSGGEGGGGLAIDQLGYLYISGTTSSTDFPVTSTAFDTSANGGADAFIAKLNPTGDSIIFATYLGGNASEERIENIAIDTDGNSYITGGTPSTSGFPITPNAFDTTNIGAFLQSFVVKLNSTGTALIYCTYTGGGRGYGTDIAVDSLGRSYCVGNTRSSGMPVTPNAIFPTHQGGDYDAYLLVISPNGDSVIYDTYLGGNSQDIGWGLRRNSQGEIFICGYTNSTNFPVTPNAHDTSYYNDGERDSFVMKIDSTLATILWCTFIGNEGWQDPWSVDIDKDDNVYVTGRTTVGGIPTTPDTYDSTYNGGNDGDIYFVKYNSTGSELLYGTYIGGFADDYSRSLIVDSTGDVYILGYTTSTDFPTTPGSFDNTYGGGNLFDVTITKFHLGPSVGTIEGMVFNDENGNSQMDSSEYVLPNWPLRLADTLNQQLQVGMTDSNGIFRFHVPAGTYDVTQIFNNDWEQSYPPTSRFNPQAINYDVNVNPGDSITDVDFGAHPLSVIQDIMVSMGTSYPYPLKSPCCGNNIKYHIWFKNVGTVPVQNVEIELKIDNDIDFIGYSSTIPLTGPVQSGRKLTWSLPNTLFPGRVGKLYATCKVHACPEDNPNWSPDINSKVTIYPIEGDETPGYGPFGNRYSYNVKATCAIDPNDKQVIPEGCGDQGFISHSESLKYIIRFQNTGSGPANLVTLRDTLDDDIDTSTVVALSSSHPCVFQRFGNELVWTFYPINLPDSSNDEVGSHGFVEFQVKTKLGLLDGTVIENAAGIYFDLNNVVMTNTTVNTLTSTPLPRALFSPLPETVAVGSQINFLYTGETTSATYYWNFGYEAIPETSSMQNPNGIMFTSEGEYDIFLTVGLGECLSEPAIQSIVVVAPHYSPNKTAVSFGAVQGGTTKTDTVKIANDGSAILYIQSVTSTNNQFLVQSYPDSILPQQQGMVILSFTPSDTGGHSGKIIVLHSAVSSPDTISVNGVGAATTVSVTYLKRWNLISNPISLRNDSLHVLFPSVNSQAFRFGGGLANYVASSRLERGIGYWVKFDTVGTIQLVGLSSQKETVNVNSNWNLLGSISEPLPVSQLTGIGTTLGSFCFAYNSGYYIVDTIMPGAGFWVRMSDSGKLVLSNSSAQKNKTLVQQMSLLSNLNTLTIENTLHEKQILYFGTTNDSKLSVDENFFQLPPSLQKDMFDVRFQSGSFAVIDQDDKTKRTPIIITSHKFPVTVSWNTPVQKIHASLLINGKEKKLNETGKLIIQEPSSVILQFSPISQLIPAQFALYQAYPNPFNPSTRIAFDLPENAIVTMIVFDVLGREVALLANNESFEAGSHSFEFNGSNLPSGIYFYRISAHGEEKDFVDVKKMLMLK